MPTKLPIQFRRLSYEEFAKAAYEVMEAVFAAHNDLGRLFDEVVYRDEIARRLEGARVEVPIEVSFEDFRKTYYLDLLWADGAIFEFKAVEKLVDRHRAQMLNYLLLVDSPHGKLVNLRPESVEHEFVNAALTRADRICFAVEDDGFAEIGDGSPGLRELLVPMLRDWGVGLDSNLYEEALTHFLGGEDRVLRPIEIRVGNKLFGQVMRAVTPNAGFKVTTLGEGKSRYEGHLRRFLAHTSLESMQWINIGRKVVSFKTIKR